MARLPPFWETWMAGWDVPVELKERMLPLPLDWLAAIATGSADSTVNEDAVSGRPRHQERRPLAASSWITCCLGEVSAQDDWTTTVVAPVSPARVQNLPGPAYVQLCLPVALSYPTAWLSPTTTTRLAVTPTAAPYEEVVVATVAVHLARPVAVSTATREVQGWFVPAFGWKRTAPRPAALTVGDMAQGTAPDAGGARVHSLWPSAAL